MIIDEEGKACLTYMCIHSYMSVAFVCVCVCVIFFLDCLLFDKITKCEA